MMNKISSDNHQQISNAAFRAYAQRYIDIERNTFTTIEKMGLPFLRSVESQKKNKAFKQQIAAMNVTLANNGKSIHSHWLSSACSACRTGEGSYTTFLSLKCHRDCYFCFNPNQENYQYLTHHQHDAYTELAQLLSMQTPLTHVALTGGEPLLHREQSVRFFQQLHRNNTDIHSRLYTAGDPLDKATAIQLQQAGLKEIRFSIKIDDSKERIEKVLRRIAIAREYIPAVMVEMPVIPGTKEEMCQLLLALDGIGIDGINLLEFCFPFNNVSEFKQRGFALKYPPYQVYYNYWYAGGLAIAESENLCLELIIFALQQQLKLGVHYCSLENKYTGQIYQQNINYPAEPVWYLSPLDYFFKSGKVFAEDISLVERVFKQKNIPFKQKKQYNFIQFHPQYIEQLSPLDVEICISSAIAEQNDDGIYYMKEVQLAQTTSATFKITDIQEYHDEC